MTVSNVITYKNKLYTKNKFSKNLENTEKNCVKGSGVRFPAFSVYASGSISSRDAAGATPVCGDVSAVARGARPAPSFIVHLVSSNEPFGTRTIGTLYSSSVPLRQYCTSSRVVDNNSHYSAHFYRATLYWRRKSRKKLTQHLKWRILLCA